MRAATRKGTPLHQARMAMRQARRKVVREALDQHRNAARDSLFAEALGGDENGEILALAERVKSAGLLFPANGDRPRLVL